MSRLLDAQRRFPLAQAVALIAIFAYGALTIEGFGQWFNVKSMLTLGTLLALAALGQTLVMILGGLDLSIPGALILMAIPVVIWLVLSRTSFHRVLYAVGGNDATAYSAGVNVAAVRIAAYALGGLFAAVAGIALTALVLSTQTASVASYTLVALAAVALGGTPLGGGRGGLLGSILGAICIFEMQTALSALGVSSSWNQVVYGGLLVVGVLVGARLQAAPVRRAVTA
jgi:ribose transport system permease protein